MTLYQTQLVQQMVTVLVLQVLYPGLPRLRVKTKEHS